MLYFGVFGPDVFEESDGCFELSPYTRLIPDFIEVHRLEDCPKSQQLDSFLRTTDLSLGRVAAAAASFCSGNNTLERILANRIASLSENNGSPYIARNTFQHFTLDECKEQILVWTQRTYKFEPLQFPLAQCLEHCSSYEHQRLIVDEVIGRSMPTFFPDYSKDIKFPDLLEKYQKWRDSELVRVEREREAYSKAALACQLLGTTKDPAMRGVLVKDVIAGQTPAFMRVAIRNTPEFLLRKLLANAIYDNRHRRDISAAAEASAALEYVQEVELQEILTGTICYFRDASNLAEARRAIAFEHLDLTLKEELAEFIRSYSTTTLEDQSLGKIKFSQPSKSSNQTIDHLLPKHIPQRLRERAGASSWWSLSSGVTLGG